MKEQVFSGKSINGKPELLYEQELPDNPALVKREAAIASLKEVARGSQSPMNKLAQAVLTLLDLE